MTTIRTNLQRVRERMAAACAGAQRQVNEVALLAVSKTFGPDAVREAFAAGQVAFGENYIQEAVEKIALLADLPLEWHCIGPIQSNKTRLVATHFHWAHTIDRLKVAQRLSEQRPESLSALQVCIQVNVDSGATKAGVAPGEVLELAREVARLPRLKLRGLMTIPEPAAGFAAQKAVHLKAKALFEELQGELREAGLALDTLSMGMTADLEAAIAAGSTMVRVGTAIFGTRHGADSVAPK
ncbi:YggS family pyridoxal phosphate-dependent enzyme [Ramlibacter sp. WS9]|uniref:YggS family pyridoxal phosphate-dependent enzyme n=1 Tax=Ramlibacter sp. WS9 TaxID=1882741 RepID=UPI0011439147|nr:YggS family pyridoxal phosphate-dependent enzyme [Ramlibacter sp. WS9]ROZ78687.1 YggS family pyridoxal phosphate-dependent enzyme [Ramlibacter sp. WS9]